MSNLEGRFDSHEKWLKHEGGERLVLEISHNAKYKDVI